MKYFCTEDKRVGTCYHEFQKGKWDEHTFWKEDSLLLSDDVLVDLELGKLFRKSLQGYDPYGPVEVNKEQWLMLLEAANQATDAQAEALQEADAWVQECFVTEEVFTILPAPISFTRFARVSKSSVLLFSEGVMIKFAF